MTWIKKQYSNGAIDRAGEQLASGVLSQEEEVLALEILNNWRSAHSFPLNTFQVQLRKLARKVDGDAVIAQRLKRVPSILLKIRRMPGMRLSRMQDIGGCRAIVSTAEQVTTLRGLYTDSRIKHRLVSEKDYIATPKDSGYRGVHLVYRYYSDKNSTYNGQQVEVQLRSRVQHAWATAVETVGTFLKESLKSSEGPEQWLRFFALASAYFAQREGTSHVPNVPSGIKLERELRSLAKSLKVKEKLRAYGEALKTTDADGGADAHYFLLVLSPAEEALAITGYRRDELALATTAYLEAEKAVAESPSAEVVLVSADSLDSLRRAYPNYFLDTAVFVLELAAVL